MNFATTASPPLKLIPIILKLPAMSKYNPVVLENMLDYALKHECSDELITGISGYYV